MTSDLKQLLDWAQSVGWTVERRHAGHLLLHYGTETVTVPATPSDRRAMLNARADLERASGVRQPRPAAGHYHYKPATGFDMGQALSEQRQAAADRQRQPVPEGLRRVAEATLRKDDDD